VLTELVKGASNEGGIYLWGASNAPGPLRVLTVDSKGHLRKGASNASGPLRVLTVDSKGHLLKGASNASGPLRVLTVDSTKRAI
jgi:hypothetical protein